MAIIVDGLPSETPDTTPTRATDKSALLAQFEQWLLAQLAQLPSASFWRVMSNPGILMLMDRMAAFGAPDEELLRAVDYALRRERTHLARKGPT
jgi:hypothetical protein